MTWRGETAKAQARLQKHTVLQLVLKPTAVFLTLQISPGMTKFSGKTEKKKNPPVSIQGSAHQLDPGEGGTHRQAVLLPVRQGSEWGSLRATAKYLCELGELPHGLSFPCLLHTGSLHRTALGNLAARLLHDAAPQRLAAVGLRVRSLQGSVSHARWALGTERVWGTGLALVAQKGGRLCASQIQWWGLCPRKSFAGL